MKAINLKKQKFTRLRVLEFAGHIGKCRVWKCRCDCGSITKVSAGHLTSGHTRSCGCLCREIHAERLRGHGAITHGHMTGGATPEYQAYNNAKQRCENPKNGHYLDYGGRGIEFRFGRFEDFLAEVGLKPTPKHSLDRKNNNGHYEVGNLRWATKLEQVRNTRNDRAEELEKENSRLRAEIAELKARVA